MTALIADVAADLVSSVGSEVRFDASNTRVDAGPDVQLKPPVITRFSWDFDASNVIQEPAFGREADVAIRPGEFEVTLTVTDELGRQAVDTLMVNVGFGSNDDCFPPILCGTGLCGAGGGVFGLLLVVMSVISVMGRRRGSNGVARVRSVSVRPARVASPAEQSA